MSDTTTPSAQPLRAQDVQVVYQDVEYGQGYAEYQVGLRIGDQVRWWAAGGYGHNDEYYKAMQAHLRALVAAFHAAQETR